MDRRLTALYSNHAEQVELQLSRAPFAYPTLQIGRCPASIFDYAYEDFSVVDYQHHPAIKAPVAIWARFGRPGVAQFTTRVFHIATSGAKVSQCRRIILRRRRPGSNASGG